VIFNENIVEFTVYISKYKFGSEKWHLVSRLVEFGSGALKNTGNPGNPVVSPASHMTFLNITFAHDKMASSMGDRFEKKKLGVGLKNSQKGQK
jgi:hypothetical protein